MADALDLVEAGLQVGLEQIVQRVNALVEENDVNVLVRQDFQWQRADVRAHETSHQIRMRLLELVRQRGGANHVRSAGIGILAVNDEAHQAGAGLRDAGDGGVLGKAFGAAIQNGHAEALGAAALRQQQAPGGRFNRGIVLAQVLVGLGGRIRVYK